MFIYLSIGSVPSIYRYKVNFNINIDHDELSYNYRIRLLMNKIFTICIILSIIAVHIYLTHAVILGENIILAIVKYYVIQYFN